jgi:hypothetical protein
METPWVTENTTDRSRGTMTHRLTFHTNSYARVLGLYLKDECPFGTLILPAEIIPNEKQIEELELSHTTFRLAGYSDLHAELKQVISNRRLCNDWCSPDQPTTYGPWLLLPAVERTMNVMQGAVLSLNRYDHLSMRHWLLVAPHLRDFTRHRRVIIGSPLQHGSIHALYPVVFGSRIEFVEYFEPLQKDDYLLVADGPR